MPNEDFENKYDHAVSRIWDAVPYYLGDDDWDRLRRLLDQRSLDCMFAECERGTLVYSDPQDSILFWYAVERWAIEKEESRTKVYNILRVGDITYPPTKNFGRSDSLDFSDLRKFRTRVRERLDLLIFLNSAGVQAVTTTTAPGQTRRASRKRLIRTSFLTESEFRKWVESLYSEGKFQRDHNNAIQWPIWFSAFGTPDGSAYPSKEHANANLARIPTDFESEIDFVRWIYRMYKEGILLKTRGKVPAVLWKTWTDTFVKPSGASYDNEQLTVPWQVAKGEDENREFLLKQRKTS